MNPKWWSVLFGVVMIGCALMFVFAPVMGWWMPRGVSSHSDEIDKLFIIILIITGFFFILTEALLVAFMYLYGERPSGQARRPSIFHPIYKPLARTFNDATKLELTWTVIPAAILLYLAIAQLDAWAVVKYKSRLDRALAESNSMPVQIGVSARQFEWRMRYPSPATWKNWKTNPKAAEDWVNNLEFDDVYIVNELHVIKDLHAVIQLTTKDVIHSFNIPYMRIKQDALPGKRIPVWFKPIASNVLRLDKNHRPVEKEQPAAYWDFGGGIDPEKGTWANPGLVWEIPCAELCGWGHYRMIGRVYVHEDEADYLAWLESASKKQNTFSQNTEKK